MIVAIIQGESVMSSIEVKSFNNPDEVNTAFNNAKMETVNVGGQKVMRLTLQPGWKWSTDIKPVVKTESCQTNVIELKFEVTF